MEIAITARHAEVSPRFRRHLHEKLSKIQHAGQTVDRIDVRIVHESNPRLAEVCERIELTVSERGLVIRAEAAADDIYGALDVALDKLSERLRRARDRRKGHQGRRETVRDGSLQPIPSPTAELPEASSDTADDEYSPVIIRRKQHASRPMSLDDALYEMELVGHDFFLFEDIESGRPTVVYRRRGWNYGVIELVPEEMAAASSASADAVPANM